MAAEFVTPEKIAFFLHHTSGYLCAPITAERAQELDLPPMVVQNTEAQRTAFLVTVDYRHDTSTGISSHDRCATVKALCDPHVRPADFARRSEEHTSELPSLMRTSYAVFCLNKN